MDPHQLLTVGHSNRTMEEFLALMTQNQVGAIADVRSQPHSRHNPQFNIERLKAALRAVGIFYVFLGDELGARRREPECYDERQAKYELIAKTEAFKRGLDRIRYGLQSHRIALMCAEKDPVTCHRMVLVCPHLKATCEIAHILDPGKLETNEQAEGRLIELVGLSSPDMFQTANDLVAQAYEIQGSRIAFRINRHNAKTATEDE